MLFTVLLTYDALHYVCHDRLFIRCLKSLLPLLKFAQLRIHTTTLQATTRLVEQVITLSSHVRVIDSTSAIKSIYNIDDDDDDDVTRGVGEPPFIGHYRVFALPMYVRQTDKPVLYMDHDAFVSDHERLLQLVLDNGPTDVLPRLWSAETCTIGTIQAASTKVTKLPHMSHKLAQFTSLNNGAIFAGRAALPALDKALKHYLSWQSKLSPGTMLWSNDSLCINLVLASMGFNRHKTYHLRSCIAHTIREKPHRFTL